MKPTIPQLFFSTLLLTSMYVQSKKNTPEFSELVFTPINSQQIRTVTIPKSKLQNALDGGAAFDGSSIGGYGTITDSDKLLKVDSNAHYSLYNEESDTATGLYFCDVYADEKTPYLGDPRTLCKHAMQVLQEKTGYQISVGTELEFYLIDKEAWEQGEITPINQSRYFDLEPDQEITTFKLEAMKALVESGVDVEKWHSEVGPAQYEISIQYTDPISLGDQLILAKHIIALHADRAGMKAIFTPKPIATENGSGLHIHFSLWNKKTNAFYDAQVNGLSQTAYTFLAGIMKYISDVAPLFNCDENSFQRLVPGFEAPIYLCYGEKNRSAAFRIPATYGSANATRFELRCPDVYCNPYLAFTAIILTGLQGLIDNEQAVPEIKSNLYTMTEEEIASLNIKRLPLSLKEALENFENSGFVKQHLPEEFVTNFLHLMK
ncbi:glutamine synthetase [bacterium]|jgi:glutamine synthetase|nr:glutamine synthetase [bacterium]MBT5015594.1 glutamine synthetase [bacterium]